MKKYLHTIFICIVISVLTIACENETTDLINETENDYYETLDVSVKDPHTYDMTAPITVMIKGKSYKTDRDEEGNFLNPELLKVMPANYGSEIDMTTNTMHIFGTQAEIDAFHKERLAIQSKEPCSNGRFRIELYNVNSDRRPLQAWSSFDVLKVPSFNRNYWVTQVAIDNTECDNDRLVTSLYSKTNYNEIPNGCPIRYNRCDSCTQADCVGATIATIHSVRETYTMTGSDHLENGSGYSNFKTYGTRGELKRGELRSFAAAFRGDKTGLRRQ